LGLREAPPSKVRDWVGDVIEVLGLFTLKKQEDPPMHEFLVLIAVTDPVALNTIEYSTTGKTGMVDLSGPLRILKRLSLNSKRARPGWRGWPLGARRVEK